MTQITALRNSAIAGTPRKQAVNAMLYNVSGTAAPATAGNGFHFRAMTTGNTPPNTAPVAVERTASTEGSLTTIPWPLIQISVFDVPRSMARSFFKNLVIN